MANQSTDQISAYRDYFEAVREFHLTNEAYVQSIRQIVADRKLNVERAIEIHVRPALTRLGLLQFAVIAVGLLSVLGVIIGLAILYLSTFAGPLVPQGVSAKIPVNRKSSYNDTYYALVESATIGSNYVTVTLRAYGDSDLISPDSSCMVKQPGTQVIYASVSNMPVREPGRYQGSLTFPITVVPGGVYSFRYGCMSLYSDARLFDSATVSSSLPSSGPSSSAVGEPRKLVEARSGRLLILISVGTGAFSFLVLVWALVKASALNRDIRNARAKILTYPSPHH